MRIFTLLIVLLMATIGFAGCIDGLFGDDDEKEENPDYPFSVRPYKSTEAVGIDYLDPITYLFEPGEGPSDGTGYLRFDATNIGEDKLCSVTCTVTAMSKTGYARADVVWELYVGASQYGDIESVKAEWGTGKQFYGLATFKDLPDEEMEFQYSFSWAKCVDESGTNLGGIVAPPRQ